MYANLLAWDYDGLTPLNRPQNEVQEVILASLKLLAVQIKHLEPDFIIFASGARRTDYIIKQVLTELGGYETSAVIPGSYGSSKQVMQSVSELPIQGLCADTRSTEMR